jgi:hypothetical protein
MQANHVIDPKGASFGSWAAGRSAMWLIVLFVALVAAVASQAPAPGFEGAVAPNATRAPGDTSSHTEWSAFVDLSLPRAVDVHFAPAGDEEAPATF